MIRPGSSLCLSLVWSLVWLAVVSAAPRAARADPAKGPSPHDSLSLIDPGAIRVVALVPADDVRQAVAIGETGEVYEPDGKGSWVHRLRCATAQPVAAAGRAGGAIVALAGGAIYRLTDNGWSAIRLVRRGKAILGAGTRSLAAVGRQLFALDPLVNGEPTRLATAPGNVVAIAAGARIVVATDTSVYQLVGPRLVALRVPRGVRIVSDRWGIAERGALDLTTGRLVAWPRDLAIGVAAGAPKDALVAIGANAGGLELVTVRGGKLARDPLGLTGTAVGVVVDRSDRAAVALSDGRIAVRDPAGWTIHQVRVEAPTEHPGAAPATSH